MKTLILLFFICMSYGQSQYTPYKTEPFSGDRLKQKSSSVDLSRFSMSQSYSMSYTSYGSGSHSSGLYLNHISYSLTPSLLLYTDIGFYNMFHTQGQSTTLRSNYGLENHAAPEFIMPNIGLEYKPNDKFTLMLQFSNWNGLAPYQDSPFTNFPSRLH